MSDLIDRKAVLDKFNAMCEVCGEGEKYNGVMCRACALDDAIAFVEDIPSAEPEEQTARVRDKKDDPMVDEWHHGRCMNCGKQVRRRNNYCSRCGSRLEWG